MRPSRLLGSALAGILLLSTGAPAIPAAADPPAHPDTGPLNILLTDDDGWDAPGITAVYDALVADGHDVTLVAPAANRSGVSAAVDFAGPLTVEHPVPGDPDIWSVSTTPVGATLFGLNEVLADDRPDLVVSGTNVGANTGFDTNFSGTVGAATVASGMHDIPAIAISTDTVHGEESTAAYDETAALLVDLLDRGQVDLPRGEFLNINYPLLTADRPAPLGVRYAPTDPGSAAAFSYRPDATDPTSWTIVPGRSDETPEQGTDRALLDAGYVTVTVLDADRTVPAKEHRDVATLVRQLDRDQDRAPVPQP